MSAATRHVLEQWTRRSDMPACCMAGTGLALGNDELLIVGGADGSLFDQADVLKDQHPGFPKQLYSYETAKVIVGLELEVSPRIMSQPSLFSGRTLSSFRLVKFVRGFARRRF